MRCWGQNNVGQLGLGNTNYLGDNEPVTSGGYVDVGGDVDQIQAGYDHTCVLLTNGRVRCWGFGAWWVLGTVGSQSNIGDTEVAAAAPLVYISDTNSVTQLALDRYSTCVLLDNGAVRCWGHWVRFVLKKKLCVCV